MRIALALALVSVAAPAAAESLVTSLSSNRVSITSNYTGAQVVLFGAIQRDGQTASRAGPYDVVVTVRGPRAAIVVREKQPFGPIWINRAQKKFSGAPAFLGIYSSRALEAISPEPLRQRHGIGFPALLAAPAFAPDTGYGDGSFRAGLLRLKAAERLYVGEEGAVTFLAPDFFRTPISLPAISPPGGYDVEVALFSDGSLLARQSQRFELGKAGFEQKAADLARDNGTLYGLAIAAMSIGLGWFASVIFRRD